MTKKSTTAKRLDPEVWDRIDRWREKGWSYTDLAHKFKLSKSTLSYRYGKNQKEKTLQRSQKRRDHFQLKIDHFFDRTIDQKRNHNLMNKRPERTWDCKVRAFHKDKNNSTKGLDMRTRRDEMNEHIWPNEGKDKNGLSFPYASCAITGKRVSVMEAKGHPLAANLDHEIPVARGGRNELSNAQLLKEKINSMKGDMTKEELFDEIFDIFRADPFINNVEKVKKCKILIKNK